MKTKARYSLLDIQGESVMRKMELGKMILACLIGVVGFGWYQEAGPAGGPIILMLWGGVWLFISAIRYARLPV